MQMIRLNASLIYCNKSFFSFYLYHEKQKNAKNENSLIIFKNYLAQQRLVIVLVYIVEYKCKINTNYYTKRNHP